MRFLAIFFLHRAAQALLVMFVISLVAFGIKDFLGDPVREMTGEAVSDVERERIRDELGLNDPWLVQYGRFAGNAARGKLPTSYFYKEPSLKKILEKFPATAELVFVTALFTILFSIPLGLFCAVRPRSFLARLVMGGSLLGISIPVFLIAYALLYAFAPPLPVIGRGENLVNILGWKTGLLTLDGLRHLLLPSLALTAIMLPLFLRLVRGEMRGIIPRDYLRTARAKGVGPGRLWFVHALRNGLLPVITVGGVQLGTLLAYTLITETVFQWGGLGSLFMTAVDHGDINLIVSYLVFTGFVFVAVNTVVDLLYAMVNPQVRTGGMA